MKILYPQINANGREKNRSFMYLVLVTFDHEAK